MQKVQLIDVESSKRNAALPLHLACRGKLTVHLTAYRPTGNGLHLACRGKLTGNTVLIIGAVLLLHLACRGKLTAPVLPSRIIGPSCILRAEIDPAEAEKSNLYISCALHMKANWQKMIHCNVLFWLVELCVKKSAER